MANPEPLPINDSEAAQAVVDAFSDLGASRTVPLSLEEMCAHLNLDPAAVRRRAEELGN